MVGEADPLSPSPSPSVCLPPPDFMSYEKECQFEQLKNNL